LFGTECDLDLSAVDRDNEVSVVKENREIMFCAEYVSRRWSGTEGAVRNGRSAAGGCDIGTDASSSVTSPALIMLRRLLTTSLVLATLGGLLTVE
jgi:hypothetical protein